MKALILNSGIGSRMGVLTSEHPKCMTEVSSQDTILSRQLRQIAEAGIEEVVMTTGLFDSVLVNYCRSLELPLHYTFIKNPLYQETNYIYSIYCAREVLRDDDVLLMHGDLVFENQVLDRVPVVMFFPGVWNGLSLSLFGTIRDDNYYRAFPLIQ